MIRLYRLLLRAYPRWFRHRFEAELLEAFTAERHRPQHAGLIGSVRFWTAIVADLLVSSHRARRRTRRTVVSSSSRSSLMDVVIQDFRHAVRQLLRRPGFSAVAVLSLALGIGGNAVIIALFDGFVFNPFAFPEPDRLVTIGSTFPRVSSSERFIEAISAPEFLDLRTARSIQSIAAFDGGNRNISGGDRPERVVTALAVTDLFAPFGLPPAMGRGFTSEELAPRGPRAAIVSYRLWQGRFGADAGIVGRSVRVNGVPTTIVGVMPPELLILGADLWIPLGADLAEMSRTFRPLTLIGRLAPGATLETANAELAAIADRTKAAHAAQFEEYTDWRVAATPWAVALMREVRSGAQLLVGAVGLVLLIVCANLSNLLLARSSTRRREMAVRHALGAGRMRVAGLLLAEVGLLTFAGAGLGLLVAWLGLPAFVRLIPPEANTLGVTASINGRVLVWVGLLTVGSAVLVALLPLLQSTRTNPQDGLREGRAATAARAQLGLRHALIVAEIALSVILLVGAGLMIRSVVNLQAVEPGFDPRNVLTMRITLPREKYQGAAINDFFQGLVDALERTPGVRTASAVSQFPPLGVFSTPFRLQGAEAPGAAIPNALITAASEEHFATLGVRLVTGRVFSSTDRADAPRVVVVNQAFVSRYLPGMAPLGQRLSTGPADRPSPPMEVVGVVTDTLNRGAREPASPEIFVPMHQQTVNNQMFLLVRSEGEAAAMLPTVRRQIAAIDPEQPIYGIRTVEDALAADTFRLRFSMMLFAVFAAMALTLAALGIYGVMSYAVSARTQEIGVRLAVGADRRDVIWMVLRQVLRLTLIGLASGVAGALALSGALRRALFEVQPTDPVTLAVVAMVLGSVALVAGWLPAVRASRVEPVTALRDQ
jgi:putative ABC transport system permease protein